MNAIRRGVRVPLLASVMAAFVVASSAAPAAANWSASGSTGVANGYTVVTNTLYLYYNTTTCLRGAYVGYQIWGIQSVWQRVGPQPSNTAVLSANLRVGELGPTCDQGYTNVHYVWSITPSFGSSNYYGPYWSWSGWPYAESLAPSGSEGIGGAVGYQWNHVFDRDHRASGWSCSRVTLFGTVYCP
jgi:hypothetical protein